MIPFYIIAVVFITIVVVFIPIAVFALAKIDGGFNYSPETWELIAYQIGRFWVWVGVVFCLVCCYIFIHDWVIYGSEIFR